MDANANSVVAYTPLICSCKLVQFLLAEEFEELQRAPGAIDLFPGGRVTLLQQDGQVRETKFVILPAAKFLLHPKLKPGIITLGRLTKSTST